MSYEDDLRKKDEIIKNLGEKIQEMEDYLKKFQDIEFKLKNQEELISNLQKSLDLKTEQVNTLNDSLKLKNEQISTYETSIKIKDEKIKTVEKTLEIREAELKSIASSTVEKNIVDEKEQKIDELNKKLEILQGELNTADEDLEALENENDRLRNELASSSGSKILDWTELEISKGEILEKIKGITDKALHNITIAVPDIKDLQELALYEVRSSVSINVSCSIDHGVELDAELLEEFESLDNISIRLYEGKDRYLIDRDGEELLLAVIGKKDNNHLIFHTRDSKHIKFYRGVVMDSWLRARKIE